MATNDIGRVTPIWRGFFSAATTYELNDIVIDTAGSVWWHKSEELTTGVIPEAGEIWDAVIDMSVFSGLIQAAITTAQTAFAAAQEAVAEVTADTERAETAAQNAEASALSASESAASVGALAQAAAASAEAAAGSATGAAGSAQAAAGSKSDAEAYAVGKRGGEDVGSTDPTYHNNAKYYAEQAGFSAEAAAQSAEDAQDVLDSIPEDYSQLSADVGDLKTQLDYYETTETLYPTYETGYYKITNGYVNENKTTANTIRTTRLAVTAGEKFKLTGISSANGPLFILTDNTLLVKDSSGNGVALTDYDVIAPTDGYLYFQPKAADTYSIARYYLREENKKAMAVYGRLIDVLRNTAFINASGGDVLKRFVDEIDVDGWLDIIGSYTINSDTGNIAPTDQNYRAVSSWFDVGSSTAITSEFTDGSTPSMQYAIYCYTDSKAYNGRGDPAGAQSGATLVSFPANTKYIRFLFMDSSVANIVDKITGRIARFTLTNDGSNTEVVYCLTKTEDLNNVI